MDCNYKVYENTASEIENAEQELIIRRAVQEHICQHTYKIIRPDISIKKDLFIVLCSFILSAALFLTFFKIIGYAALAVIPLWVFLFSRRLILLSITMYQKYAPEFVRASCRFEPCCSEYMKLAVLKYGVIKGCAKGIKRISRCRYPNGGTDEP